MKTRRLRTSLATAIIGLVLMNTVWAGAPVWTFAPVSGYPSSVNVSPSETATIKYTVINQSHRPHLLEMKAIQGITSSGCTAVLSRRQESCTLTLTVKGSDLKGDVLGGPILCERRNPNQCYQPSQANSLAIRLEQAPPVQQYTVTSSAGVNGSVSPDGSQTVNSGASITFTATPDSGYGVHQWLVDSVLAQTGGTTYQLANITANHTVHVTFSGAELTSSVSTLGLSVNCPSSSSCTPKNDALTGNPRQITITNTGSIDAINVVVGSSGLPSDAVVSPSSCGTLVANGGQCVITVTPGATASANASSVLCTAGVQPEGSVNVSADGGVSTSIDTYILSYGCIYQGGFIYSVDDTTADTGSIGGKVVSLTDQAAPFLTSGSQPTGIIFSSNGAGGASANVSNDIIPSISQVSTGNDSYNTAESTFNSTYSNTSTFPFPASGAFSSCTGATQGACNSNNILALYNLYNTGYGIGSSPYTLSSGITNPTYYAAGFCTTTINTYSDWYLPAICELDALSSSVTCPAGLQSMVGNLAFLIGNPSAGTPSTSCSPPSGTDCLAGGYWSSTQFSFAPQNVAWGENFTSTGSGSAPGGTLKYALFGLRCTRALTV